MFITCNKSFPEHGIGVNCLTCLIIIHSGELERDEIEEQSSIRLDNLELETISGITSGIQDETETQSINKSGPVYFFLRLKQHFILNQRKFLIIFKVNNQMSGSVAIFLEYITPYNVTTTGKGFQLAITDITISTEIIRYKFEDAQAQRKYMGTVVVPSNKIESMNMSFDFYLWNYTNDTVDKSNFPGGDFDSIIYPLLKAAQQKPGKSVATTLQTGVVGWQSIFTWTFQVYFPITVGIPDSVTPNADPLFFCNCFYKTAYGQAPTPIQQNAIYINVELATPAVSYSNYFTTNIDYVSFGLQIPLYSISNQTLVALQNEFGFIDIGFYNFITKTTNYANWTETPSGTEFYQLAQTCINNNTKYEQKSVVYQQKNGTSIIGSLTLVYEVYYINAPSPPTPPVPPIPVDDDNEGLAFDLNMEYERELKIVEDLISIERRLLASTFPQNMSSESEFNIPLEIVQQTLTQFAHLTGDKDFQAFVSNSANIDAPYKVQKLAQEAINRYKNTPQSRQWITSTFGSIQNFEASMAQLPIRQRLGFLFGGKIGPGSLTIPILHKIYQNLYPQDKQLFREDKTYQEMFSDTLSNIWNFQIGPQGAEARAAATEQLLNEEEYMYNNQDIWADNNPYDNPADKFGAPRKSVSDQRTIKPSAEETQQLPPTQTPREQSKIRDFLVKAMAEGEKTGEQRPPQHLKNIIKALTSPTTTIEKISRDAIDYAYSKAEQAGKNAINDFTRNADEFIEEKLQQMKEYAEKTINTVVNDPLPFISGIVDYIPFISGLRQEERNIIKEALETGVLISVDKARKEAENRRIAHEVRMKKLGEHLMKKGRDQGNVASYQHNQNNATGIVSSTTDQTQSTALDISQGSNEIGIYENESLKKLQAQLEILPQYETAVYEEVLKQNLLVFVDVLDMQLKQQYAKRLDQLTHGPHKPVKELGESTYLERKAYYDLVEGIKRDIHNRQDGIAFDDPGLTTNAMIRNIAGIPFYVGLEIYKNLPSWSSLWPKQVQKDVKIIQQDVETHTKEPAKKYNNQDRKYDLKTAGRIRNHMEREIAEKRLKKFGKLARSLKHRGPYKSKYLLYNWDTPVMLGKRLRRRF